MSEIMDDPVEHARELERAALSESLNNSCNLVERPLPSSEGELMSKALLTKANRTYNEFRKQYRESVLNWWKETDYLVAS